ncbi:TIM-barrel domain-containing protein [Neobacillus terrae]|uniref:glycoside hydrolase family 31 protein n=1 Tax=Neobacillus terrae TaxID=3034837 RepID=UPI00140C4D46|nr:TIM-barrel domain-containing protein [Neobacillus terrae]NHM33618.1 glycoside hydrolase family 31 protein [Neobacillus terrae]
MVLTTEKSLSSFFHIHYLQLKDKEEKAQGLLKNEIENSSSTPIEQALWTWLLTEQVMKFQNKNLLSEYKSFISQTVETIESQWNKKQEHLYLPIQNDIFTVHLSIYYAVLVNLKNIGYSPDIQKTATEVRDRVFENQLKGGMVICSPENSFASTDLLLSVLPFGLFSPEDLVMVEAVKKMESSLVSNRRILDTPLSNEHSDLAASLLSWYFLEKGDKEKSKHYLGLNTGITGSSALYLKNIVEYYSSLEENHQIIHEPFGNGNRYEPQAYERFPKMPIENEEVIIQFIAPFSENAKAFIHVKTNAGTKKFQATYTNNGEKSYWQANIGCYIAHEEVAYQIEWSENDKNLTSAFYSFYPLEKLEIKNLVGNQIDGNSFEFWSDKGEYPFSLSLNTNLNTIHITKENKIEVRDELLDINKILTQHNLPRLYTDTNVAPITLLINRFGEWVDLSINFYSPSDERFFGMGERYHQLEYRGEILDCYVYNQYRDQGARTYMPLPFFFSSLGYGLHIDTSRYTKFDFAKTFDDLLSISVDQQADNGTTISFFKGTPSEIVGQFTNKTGPAEMVPVWALGPWMSSNNWDRDEIVREQVRKTTELQIPATVLVLEQWSDEATYYIFNDATYEATDGSTALSYEDYNHPQGGRWPNPKNLVKYINEHGMELILWQIPIMKYLNRQHHPQKDNDERYMIKEQYFIRDKNDEPYRIPEGWFKESLLMDFSNPEGVKWWFDKRKYLLDIGVAGFKTDGGEMVFGEHIQFADERSGSEMRNEYPNDYIKAYYEFAQKHRPNNSMTFSRAGYTGVQKIPAHWAGDERSTFDAFKRSLIAGLSAGLSGIIMWGWDLAGFNGEIPTAELFIRSAQMAAFCPIMQYHAESKAEFNQDRTPWNLAERTGDERAITGYRFYANVRMNLLPYIAEQAKLSVEKGKPLMRAMLLECPKDPKTYSMYDQYFFGDFLLVAPIIQEGSERRSVYLPENKWVNLFSKQVFDGARFIEVDAPLMEIPVFLRNNSCLITNVNKERLSIGQYVGNSIDSYQYPLVHIVSDQNFTYQGKDHLNNNWVVNVMHLEENSVLVEMETIQNEYAIAYTNTLDKKISLCLKDFESTHILGPRETKLIKFPVF